MMKTSGSETGGAMEALAPLIVKFRGLSPPPPQNVPCVPLLRVGNHVDFISNGKIMATGRQVRQIGIEEFFYPEKIQKSIFQVTRRAVHHRVQSRIQTQIKVQTLNPRPTPIPMATAQL